MTKRIAGPVAKSAGFYDTIISGIVALSDVVPGVPLSATPQSIFEVRVQNDPGSAANVFVGGPDGQVIVLTAGASITIPANNLNLVYVRSANATVNWLAMA